VSGTPRQRMARAAALLAGLQILAHAAALGRQVLIAATFGTTATLDAYLVAAAVAGLVLAWVLEPLRQVLVPAFRHDVARRGEARAWRHVSLLFNNVGVALLLMALLGVLLSPVLVRVVAPGFDTATLALAASLTTIVLFSVVFAGLAGLLAQIAFAGERFGVAGTIALVDHVVVIGVFLALRERWGIHALAAAVVAGGAAQLAVLVPMLWRRRAFLTGRVDPRDPHTREVGRLSGPLLVGTTSTEVSRVSDRIFASLLPAGSLAALAYASRLVSAANDLIMDSLQQSTHPHFARLTAEGRFAQLSRQLFRYVRLVVAVTVPAAVGLAVLAPDIVGVVLRRGAFDEASVRLTALALALYALGFPAQALARVLNRTFYGFKDTRTPTRLALGRIALKIALTLALLRPLAHGAIALADSLSQLVRVAWLARRLPRELDRAERRAALVAALRTGLTAGVMAAALLATRESALQALGGVAGLGALVAGGALVYTALSFWLQPEEVRGVLAVLQALRSRVDPSRARPAEAGGR
jgi:putative peptidoglycan lipid II flippase